MTKDFYDELSKDYNELIQFDYQKRKSLLANHISEDYKFAADIGCGTGIDSISLSELGLSVDAFDLSAKQLDFAKRKAMEFGLSIDFYNYSINEIPNTFLNKYQLICSLGNTFANIDRGSLKSGIKNIHSFLEPKGKLIIQLINYSRVLALKDRIINITESEKNTFVRFYDFNANDTLTFNVLKFNKQKNSNRKLISTTVYPYQSNELTDMLLANGFTNIKLYGSLSLGTYSEINSKDLVITAEKS